MTTVMGEGKKKSAWQGEPAPWGAEQLFCPSWGRGEGRGRGRDHVGKAIKFLLPALLSNGCHVCVPPSCLHSQCVILFAELPLGGGCSSTVPPHPPPLVLVQEPPHAATHLLGRSPPAAPPPSQPLLQRSAPSGFGHGGEDAQPMHALDLLAQCLQQMNIRAESHRNTKVGALKSRAPHSGPCSPALRALT